MNNSVRNEAQRAGIAAVAIAVVVLVIFFLLSKSGVGSAGPAADTSASTQTPVSAPSPMAT